jgi:hypothetical protein
MKKTNKCRICGKRYKLPVGSDLEMREYICFNCEFSLDFLNATMAMLHEHRGFKFTEEKYREYKKLIKLKD